MAGHSLKSMRDCHAKTLKIVLMLLNSLKSGNPKRKFVKILKTKLKLLKLLKKGRKKLKEFHNAKYCWVRRVPSPSKPTRKKPNPNLLLTPQTSVKFHWRNKKNSSPSRAFKSCQFSDIFIYYVLLYQSYLHLFWILINYLITEFTKQHQQHSNPSSKPELSWEKKNSSNYWINYLVDFLGKITFIGSDLAERP